MVTLYNECWNSFCHMPSLSNGKAIGNYMWIYPSHKIPRGYRWVETFVNYQFLGFNVQLISPYFSFKLPQYRNCILDACRYNNRNCEWAKVSQPEDKLCSVTWKNSGPHKCFRISPLKGFLSIHHEWAIFLSWFWNFTVLF